MGNGRWHPHSVTLYPSAGRGYLARAPAGGRLPFDSARFVPHVSAGDRPPRLSPSIRTRACLTNNDMRALARASGGRSAPVPAPCAGRTARRAPWGAARGPFRRQRLAARCRTIPRAKLQITKDAAVMVTTDLGACEWFVWDLRRSNLID